MTTIEPTPDVAPATDIAEFLDELAAAAVAQGDTAAPAIAGTFAMYPMETGGLVVVFDVREGPLAGTHRHIMPPAMIRAVTALASGGGKLGALKAMMSRGRAG